MTVYPQDVHESPPISIFGTHRRWPLLPSAELHRLQAALTQCVELAGPDSAHELLTLVSDELVRRTEEEPAHLRRHNVRPTGAAQAGTPGRRRRRGPLTDSALW